MNKFIVGALVLLAGGLIGWYYFQQNPDVMRKDAGQFDTQQQGIPAQGTDGGGVTISDESTAGGTTKGGLVTEVTVSYTDSGYTPKEITVKTGSTVTFRNDSSGGMWTASGQHPTHQLLPGFDQLKSVTKGGTYVYTFTKVGTWKYHNHVKPADTGVVVVTE